MKELDRIYEDIERLLRYKEDNNLENSTVPTTGNTVNNEGAAVTPAPEVSAEPVAENPNGDGTTTTTTTTSPAETPADTPVEGEVETDNVQETAEGTEGEEGGEPEITNPENNGILSVLNPNIETFDSLASCKDNIFNILPNEAKEGGVLFNVSGNITGVQGENNGTNGNVNPNGGSSDVSVTGGNTTTDASTSDASTTSGTTTSASTTTESVPKAEAPAETSQTTVTERKNPKGKSRLQEAENKGSLNKLLQPPIIANLKQNGNPNIIEILEKEINGVKEIFLRAEGEPDENGNPTNIFFDKKGNLVSDEIKNILNGTDSEEKNGDGGNNPNPNDNVSLNYRLNDVIENPQIQAEIEKVKEPITALELKKGTDNQQKVMILGESYESPIELPNFIRRFMEDKELGVLNAGSLTNLNPYLTKEVRDKLQAAGKEVAKIMLSKDGNVLMLDKNYNPIVVDKPEEHEGENEEPGSDITEITKPITITELTELVGKINPSLDKHKEAISTVVAKSLAENGYTFELTELKLSGKAVKGTYLNESEETEDTNKEKKETKKEKPNLKGPCEVYVTGGFILNKTTEEDGGTGETDNQSFKRTNWEDVLREAQILLREDTNNEEIDNPEALVKIVKGIQQTVVNALNDGKDLEKTAKKIQKELKKKNKEAKENNDYYSRLNEDVKLKTTTKNDNTFTGYQAQKTSFTFAIGNEQRIKVNGSGGNYQMEFTIIIKKGNAKDTVGSVVDKVFGAVTGIANMSNKIALNGGNSAKVGTANL